MTAKTLPELVQQDIGAPARRRQRDYWWRCPFHDEDTASFQVDFYEARQKWRYKCWGCDKEGDAQDWLVDYRHMSSGDAWRFLHGDAAPQPARSAERPAPVVDYGEPPDAAWQDAALDMVLDCAANLQNANDERARQVLNWLQTQRGLSPETIQRAMLGWNPGWREVLPGHKLAPGVVIPCFADDALWYVKVRLGRDDAQRMGQKYTQLAGGQSATLYGADSLAGARVALAVEGEFDALLASQFFAAGELSLVTMGSANALPGARWLRLLAWLDKLLVVMDADDAGERARQKWRDVATWLEVVPPPPVEGKDVTDWWTNGLDLRAWLTPYMVSQNVA